MFMVFNPSAYSSDNTVFLGFDLQGEERGVRQDISYPNRKHQKGERMFKFPVIAILVFALLLGGFGCASQQASPSPSAKTEPAKSEAVKTEPAKSAPTASKPAELAPAKSEPTKTEPAKLEKVKVLYAGPSAGFAPVWIAKDTGLFEKYGLDVELENITGGTAVLLPSLISGESQFGEMSAPGPMTSYISGGGTVWIGTAVNTAVLFLMANPSITKVEDLKGKAIGVTKIGSLTDTFARLTLKKYGLDPQKDVSIVQTGGIAETLAALKANQIYAGVEGPPSNVKAKAAGFKQLVDISSLGIAYPMSGVVATQKFIKEKPDTVRKFMKAYVEAIYVMKTDPKTSKQVISKYTKTTDATELEESYTAFASRLETVPYPTVDAMKVAADALSATNPKAKSIDPKEYFDDSFVKELDSSGFIKALYAKK